MKIVESKSGAPTLVIGERYLHSKYDPVKEAQREISAVAGDNPAVLVILGTGLGYTITEALKILPNTKILAVESNPDIYRLMMENRQISESERIFFVVGKNRESNFEAITRCIDASAATCIKYISRLSVLDDKHYSEITEMIGKVAEMQIEGLNSMVRFGPLWWENSVRNYREWAELPDASGWFGAFSKTPVFIFAAGPTLSDNLDLFADGEGGLRFAVDTAYPILVKAGIRVDAVFAVDAQKMTLAHFEGAQPDFLLGAPVIPPELWKLAKKSVILSLDGPHFSWFDIALGRRTARLKSGGSVTTFAFDLARRMTAEKIILVGADFAHRHGRRHSSGTAYEHFTDLIQSRFFSIESSNRQNQIQRDGFETESQLAQYAQWMKWEIYETSRPVFRTADFGLLKDVPVIDRAELKKIISTARPEFYRPNFHPVDSRFLIEAFKMEKIALQFAMNGDATALRELSGFFDPIIRPYAVVSQREELSAKLLNELFDKLRSANRILDEVISGSAENVKSEP